MRHVFVLMAWMLLFGLPACGDADAPPSGEGASSSSPEARIPGLDTSALEPLVAELIDRRMASVRSNAGNARAWADLGFALDAHMFLEEAEACLGQALELDGDLFPAAYDHAFLGTLLPREFEDVSARFEGAIALQPDYAPALVRQGDYLLAAGQVEQAAESFRAALAIWPAYAYAELGLARTQLAGTDEADWARACEALDSLFATFSADPAVATAYAQALTLLGRSDEAASISESHAAAVAGGGRATVPVRDTLRAEILSLSATAAANFQRGEGKLRAGDFQGAAREMERVLGFDPENRVARLLLAKARIGLGASKAARDALADLLEANPKDPDAHAMMGQLDTEVGQFDAAIAHFARASQSGSLDGATWRAWVTALGSLQRWDEALFRIDEWKLAAPGAADPFFLEALARKNAGQAAEAEAALEEAVRRAPTHPMRREIEPLMRVIR
ncbi:cellulose synthase subunit BcsC [Planctomycetes bacterium Poly30]|uniref:Cellulose synthase subunit BcsC n=1 Tax=Saltatorellus ferox TaxID=2528018 RepID=A0A518EXA6_9BACT|nr:cellulose synthase subunit BcsC [Planctomycetes bacterium Poly30]